MGVRLNLMFVCWVLFYFLRCSTIYSKYVCGLWGAFM